jgi:hypothetical protein
LKKLNILFAIISFVVLHANAQESEDGIGIAVPLEEITSGECIVGRAWENHPDPGIKRVNTVVGLDHGEAKDAIIRGIQMQLLQLQQ